MCTILYTKTSKININRVRQHISVLFQHHRHHHRSHCAYTQSLCQRCAILQDCPLFSLANTQPVLYYSPSVVIPLLDYFHYTTRLVLSGLWQAVDTLLNRYMSTVLDCIYIQTASSNSPRLLRVDLCACADSPSAGRFLLQRKRHKLSKPK